MRIRTTPGDTIRIMSCVYLAADSARAEIMRSALADAGIRAVIEGGLLGAVAGEIPIASTYPRICVEDADVDAARRVIADSRFDGRPPSHCRECGYDLRGLSEPRCPECGSPFTSPHLPASWTCPVCAEESEGQFAACWLCGAPRPASDPPDS